MVWFVLFQGKDSGMKSLTLLNTAAVKYVIERLIFIWTEFVWKPEVKSVEKSGNYCCTITWKKVKKIVVP